MNLLNDQYCWPYHLALYYDCKIALGGYTFTFNIQYVCGIDQDTYTMDEIYSEGLAHRIIWACHEVTTDTVESITTDIGYSFYKFLGKYEFNKVTPTVIPNLSIRFLPFQIVRVLGRTFPQFLNGLDNLHEYLRFSFPKLKPPSFYCEHESRTGLTLHYR